MKRKLLAICLASLIILQLGCMTIFAQNLKLIISDEAKVEVGLNETKNEVEANSDASSENNNSEILESDQNITESLNNTLTENDTENTSETISDIPLNEGIVETSSETEKWSDDLEELSEKSNIVNDETKNIKAVDYDYINRNVSDSLFENATIIFDQNVNALPSMTPDFNESQNGETVSINSVSSDVYTTAPTIFNTTSLRLSEPEVP